MILARGSVESLLGFPRRPSKGNKDVRDLKAFLKLRDHSPAFTLSKARGAAVILCCVLEDGTVTLSPEDVGLHSLSFPAGGACSLDGLGC